MQENRSPEEKGGSKSMISHLESSFVLKENMNNKK